MIERIDNPKNMTVKLCCGVTVVNVKPLFSYDSQNIIVASGKEIKVFIIKSGECIQTLIYHTRPVIGLQECKSNLLQFFSCSDDSVVVRWDYTGTRLQVYNLHIKMPITCFYTPYQENNWFISAKIDDTYKLYSFEPKSYQGHKNLKCVVKPVYPKGNTVAFGVKDRYIASVYENSLTISWLDSEGLKRHKTGERNLTCVVCHPSESVLATGDDQGRVILWANYLDSNKPVRSIYHWHNLPVADLVFSSEASHIYSGGGESALVRWNLFSEEKTILPRMGAPIERIVTSKDNSYVMTTHSDNVLHVVDAQRNIVQVIQGLTKSQSLYKEHLPVGVLYNSHLKSLVMNGKPGHLQFYDVQQDKFLFNLDIVSKNFISNDRDSVVYNIDIQKAATDDSGMWLATTEYWCNQDSSPQIWLKFWKFDLEKQTFALNTNVYLPHNKELNCITFKPSPKQSDDSAPLVVTTSSDSYFKIWTLNTVPHESKESWGCEYTDYYRDLIPGSAAFSDDGTVLAVAFGRAATLWGVDSLSMKAVLFNKKSEHDIKQLLFGHHSSFKYLLCHDGFSITAWDCVSFSASWIVHYEIQFLAADKYSENVAAFCKDQNLKIFNPSSPHPLECIKNASDHPVVSAVFVPTPNSNQTGVENNKKSQLYFLDEKQNLFTVTETCDQQEVVASEKAFISQNIAETPFGVLQAEQSVSGVKIEKVEKFDIQKEKEVGIILNPTWCDTEVLLRAMLSKSLIKESISEEPRNSTSDLQAQKSDNEQNIGTVKVKFDDNWMSEAFAGVTLKEVDFSSLAKEVKFVTEEMDTS